MGMMVDFEYATAARDLLGTDNLPDPGRIVMGRQGEYWFVVDDWGNFRFFAKEQEAHWDIRRLRQGARCH